MPDEIITKHANIAYKNLRMIIASGGKSGGTFYFVGGAEKGHSGLSIQLDKKDKKGNLVKSAGKELKKVSRGSKFCLGTLRVEGGKLVFRIRKGTLAPKVVKDSFKTHFEEIRTLTSLLKKANVVKGDAALAEADADAKAEEELTDDDMLRMRRLLLAGARGTEREDLLDILDNADEQIQVNTNLNSAYVELMEDDDRSDYDEEEMTQLINSVEELYRGMQISRKQLFEMSRKLAERDVDLSAFEDNMQVGDRIPEPIRSQILLSKKILDGHKELNEAATAFPQNVLTVFAELKTAIDTAKSNIVGDLRPKVAAEAQLTPPKNSFARISDFISNGGLFEDRIERLEKYVTEKRLNTSHRNPRKVAGRLELIWSEIDKFEVFLMISAKIRQCDSYCPSTDIRGTLIPKLTIMKQLLQSKIASVKAGR